MAVSPVSPHVVEPQSLAFHGNKQAESTSVQAVNSSILTDASS